jgi:hypothetical protein
MEAKMLGLEKVPGQTYYRKIQPEVPITQPIPTFGNLADLAADCVAAERRRATQGGRRSDLDGKRFDVRNDVFEIGSCTLEATASGNVESFEQSNAFRGFRFSLLLLFIGLAALALYAHLKMEKTQRLA